MESTSLVGILMGILAMSSGIYAVIHKVGKRKQDRSSALDLENLNKNPLEKRERLEQNLQRAQQIAKIGTWELDLINSKILLSDQICQIHELGREVTPHIDIIRSLVIEEDQTSFDEGLKNIYNGKPCASLEYKIVTPSGEQKHLLVEADVVYNLDGSLLRVSGITQDITDRVKSIEAQIEAEKKYRLLIDHSPTGIFKSTLSGGLTYVNDTMVKMFGFDSADELLNKGSHTLYKHPEDRKMLLDIIQKQGELKDYKMECVTKDGQSFFVSQTSILEGDELHGILMDITHRVKSEQENTALINRLKEQNNDLEEFSHVISHNLRTPIVNLMGLTQIFDHTDISQDNLEILDLIEQSTTDLDLIIKDLNKTLTIRDRREEIYETVNLKSILERVKSSLHEDIQNSSVIIGSNITTNDQIRSVASYIQNILYNLIDNAIKYRSPDRKALVTIEFKCDGAKNKLIVSDNGIGMDLSSSDQKIFKLYERLHPHLNPKGRGLGLYLVKNQVNALQGTIEVNSRPDEGATFIIEFPDRRFD